MFCKKGVLKNLTKFTEKHLRQSLSFSKVTGLRHATEKLESALSRFSQVSFGTFKSTVDNILQKHAPIKKRYVRANQASFINSKIHKEAMRRTRLRNKFIDSKVDADRIAYNKQRNYCVSLIRKDERNLLQQS